MDKMFQARAPMARVPVRLKASWKKLLWRAAGILLAIWMGIEVLRAVAAATAARHGALSLSAFGHIV